MMVDFLSIFLFFSLLSPSSARHGSSPFGLRISCGALKDVHTPGHNSSWYKDFGSSGGISANGTRPSAITPPLKTVRYFPLSDGLENCYQINGVPLGHYSVRVFFGLVDELEFDDEPLFDVSIEGTQLYSLKAGWSYNDDDQAFVEALLFFMNGSASLCFHSTGHGDPTILSIEILQVGNSAYNFGPGFGQGSILRTVKRINCGAENPNFDADFKADFWGGDRFWNTLGIFRSVSQHIIHAEEAIDQVSFSPNFYPENIYQTALIGSPRQPNISFLFDVEPNRNYSVWLHFAEIDPSITGAGERVFDILINDDIVFNNVDIVDISGDVYTAFVLNKTVSVIGRSLTINLNPKMNAKAIVSAIEIFEVIPSEIKSSPDEVKALQILKDSLGLPRRFGWHGDPCVPRMHPWSGVRCGHNIDGSWVITELELDTQGLRGLLPNEISQLEHLQSINLSGNSLHGVLPPGLGNLTRLEKLDLSYNLLNGSIPQSLGWLASLKKLYLNSNSLSGRVPPPLEGRLLHGASVNLTDNAGLCGIPGLPNCKTHFAAGAKVGIGSAVVLGFPLIIICLIFWWKRRQNVIRIQKITTRDAPYAKARTHFSQDVQMTIHNNRTIPGENGHSNNVHS